MGRYSHLNQVDYARTRRQRKDKGTGGFLICPGSFFPYRDGVLVEGNFIHALEIQKRKGLSAYCEHCKIQFILKGPMWEHFEVLPIYCGSEAPIPGVSISKKETEILMPRLSEAKIKAIDEWREKAWNGQIYNQILASPEESIAELSHQKNQVNSDSYLETQSNHKALDSQIGQGQGKG